MTWYILAAIGPAMFVAYQAFSKLLPKDVSALVLNMYALLVGAGVMFVLSIVMGEAKSFAVQSKYYWVILMIGVFVALGNVTIIKAYALGATQSGFTSLFYSLLIVYGTFAGLLIWKEKLSLLQGVGIVFILCGIALVTLFKK